MRSITISNGDKIYHVDIDDFNLTIKCDGLTFKTSSPVLIGDLINEDCEIFHGADDHLIIKTSSVILAALLVPEISLAKKLWVWIIGAIGVILSFASMSIAFATPFSNTDEWCIALAIVDGVYILLLLISFIYAVIGLIITK